jgi:hypothetical protein
MLALRRLASALVTTPRGVAPRRGARRPHLLLDEQRFLCGIIDQGDLHAGGSGARPPDRVLVFSAGIGPRSGSSMARWIRTLWRERVFARCPAGSSPWIMVTRSQAQHSRMLENLARFCLRSIAPRGRPSICDMPSRQ